MIVVTDINDAPNAGMLRKARNDMDKKSGITIKCKCETEGFDEATEKVETLVDAFNEFPPQVQIKNCRDCNINIYPSQTKIIDKTESEEGAEQ